jgi:hypothetical protein
MLYSYIKTCPFPLVLSKPGVLWTKVHVAMSETCFEVLPSALKDAKLCHLQELHLDLEMARLRTK